ncbi:MAG: helix-turn-helix transcriptional regulator [Candidatus Limnocylindrales bacterium]
MTGRREEPRLFNRLRVLRAERGLSRQDLAAALDINYQTVGYLERGDYNPSLHLAFQIAEYFELPIEAIFSREPFGPMSDQLYGQEAGRRSG